MVFNVNEHSSSGLLRSYRGPSVSKANAISLFDSGIVYPVQQSFLGATIVSFSASAGVGSNSSNLSVNLVEDSSFDGIPEGGTSPVTQYDPYHNGSSDSFSPPSPGCPVFFHYSCLDDQGSKATLSQAFSKTKPSFTFGGILQSVNRTSGANGYTCSVNVTDPKIVLGNVKMILDSYAGTVNLNNIINVYGFLEHEAKPSVRANIISQYPTISRLSVSSNGLSGVDMYWSNIPDSYTNLLKFFDISGKGFPITGLGMSRRGPHGLFYYRIIQALAACKDGAFYAGDYTGEINFRGFKYFLNITDAPPVDPLYSFSGQSVSLLDFFVEIADFANYELVVTLSPPDYNAPANIGGTINVGFLDRSSFQTTGNISSLVSTFEGQNTYSTVKNRDVGLEVCNQTVQKIVVGANRVEMIALTSNHDYGNKAYYAQSTSNSSPSTYGSTDVIKPFWGTVGSDNTFVNAKGDGSWAQVYIDTTGLGAYGVDISYIATVLEIKLAMQSFQRWKSFLEFMNGLYISHVNNYDVLDATTTEVITNYAVKVPRCKWLSNKGFRFITGPGSSNIALPISPCHPPYGYPLYYGRASSIGLTTNFQFDGYSISIDIGTIKGNAGRTRIAVVDALIMKYSKIVAATGDPVAINTLKNLQLYQKSGYSDDNLLDYTASLQNPSRVIESDSKDRQVNVQKVFSMLRDFGNDVYGKKFLVRLPTVANKYYKDTLSTNGNIFNGGPIGFKSKNLTPNNSINFISDQYANPNTDEHYENGLGVVGRYDAVTQNYAFSFLPCKEGGFATDPNKALNAILPKNSYQLINNNRLSSFVRFDYPEVLSIDKNSTSCIIEKQDLSAIKPSRPIHVPSASNDINEDIKDSYLYMKTDLDAKLYFPAAHVFRQSKPYGGYSYRNVKLFPEISVNISGQATVTNQTDYFFYPTGSEEGQANSISDFYRSNEGYPIAYPDVRYPHVLITLPQAVTISAQSIQTNNNVFEYDLNVFGDDIATVWKTTTPKKFLDFDTSSDAARFFSPFTFSNLPYICLPSFAVVALEHQTETYGPWLGGVTDGYTHEGLGGDIEYEQDTSLAPWNYGGYESMNIAGHSKTKLANSLQSVTERGSVTFAGFPRTNFDVADLIFSSGPMLSSLDISVSASDISTTYKFESYTQSFAKQNQLLSNKIDHLNKRAIQANDVRNELISKSLIGQRFRNTFTTDAKVSMAGSSSSAETYTPISDVLRINTPNTGNYTSAGMSNSYSAEVGDTSIGRPSEQFSYHSRSADTNISQIYCPTSRTPDHPSMPAVADEQALASSFLYDEALSQQLDDGFDPDEDITTSYT